MRCDPLAELLNGLPMRRCIEQAIRDAPMPPFTDATWATDFLLLVSSSRSSRAR